MGELEVPETGMNHATLIKKKKNPKYRNTQCVYSNILEDQLPDLASLNLRSPSGKYRTTLELPAVSDVICTSPSRVFCPLLRLGESDGPVVLLSPHMCLP